MFARLMGSRRFTDEHIFTILRAGEEDGVNTAELCAAHGITVPMYCVWKARYGPLTLDELRSVRQWERKRAMIRRAVFGTATVVVLGALGLLLMPRSTSPLPPDTAAATARPAAAPEKASRRAATDRPPRAAKRQAAATAGSALDAAASPPVAPAVPDPVIERPVVRGSGASVPSLPPPPVEQGFSVQIAAPPDVPQARSLVDQLVGSGYPAYAVPVSVNGATLYRVRVGPFGTRSEAQEVERRLKNDGHAGAWIAAVSPN